MLIQINRAEPTLSFPVQQPPFKPFAQLQKRLQLFVSNAVSIVVISVSSSFSSILKTAPHDKA
ncbi:hypothetical protein [Aridibaculum aurantiacum]|uniref:hypothetical protein n=1 Tax=Aridibaculum aurantiacum TaxID=2810307 RepID=UPI001A95E77D|nr:hypothetical protein [Aridibaculum aurantiacum]